MRHSVTLLFLSCISAFAQTPDGSAQTMQSLLTEVRQLRLAIERSTLLGTRMQIAMGRLQAEDTRTMRAAQDLDKARTDLFNVQAEQARVAGRIKEQEQVVPRIQDAEERVRVEYSLKQSKVELESLAATESPRRAREAELASQVQAGRARVTEQENRITEMERALDLAIRQLTPP